MDVLGARIARRSPAETGGSLLFSLEKDAYLGDHTGDVMDMVNSCVWKGDSYNTLAHVVVQIDGLRPAERVISEGRG